MAKRFAPGYRGGGLNRAWARGAGSRGASVAELSKRRLKGWEGRGRGHRQVAGVEEVEKLP